MGTLAQLLTSEFIKFARSDVGGQRGGGGGNRSFFFLPSFLQSLRPSCLARSLGQKTLKGIDGSSPRMRERVGSYLLPAIERITVSFFPSLPFATFSCCRNALARTHAFAFALLSCPLEQSCRRRSRVRDLGVLSAVRSLPSFLPARLH